MSLIKKKKAVNNKYFHLFHEQYVPTEPDGIGDLQNGRHQVLVRERKNLRQTSTLTVVSVGGHPTPAIKGDGNVVSTHLNPHEKKSSAVDLGHS